MVGDVIQQKAAMRREIRARLQGIAPEQRLVASREVCSKLQQSAAWNSARTILFFAPMREELDVWPLLEAALAGGRISGLPRFISEAQTYAAVQVKDLAADVRPGKFGIREPVESCAEIPWERIDLVLVPGLAFDLGGRRLGRGRGFYDRLLARVRGIKCGVAFDEQIVSEVPTGPCDERVDFLATQARFTAVH